MLMEGSGSVQLNTDPDPGGSKLTDPDRNAVFFYLRYLVRLFQQMRFWILLTEPRV
jgi:hypothetical protein